MSGEKMLMRMARVFYDRDKAADWPADERLPFDECKGEYLSDAEAALEAIREPSAISRWSGSVQFERAKAEGYDAADAADMIFTAMIDAILNESPSPSVTHQTGDKT